MSQGTVQQQLRHQNFATCPMSTNTRHNLDHSMRQTLTHAYHTHGAVLSGRVAGQGQKTMISNNNNNKNNDKINDDHGLKVIG